MKISLIYDNTTINSDFLADWGFAALVETDDLTILFDTGGDGKMLLHNMSALDIDPGKIDTVFISHHHFDHIGGLAAFLQANPNVTVYAPPLLRGITRAKEVVYVEKPMTLSPNVFSTGELAGIEQSLCVKLDDGLVVIVGCSHPGVDKILDAAKQFGEPTRLIGGLHGFDNFELLAPLKLICPTHCTQHQKEIFKLYPQTAIQGGVGRTITI
jgi:7,8-dihydropterin-6-yl-methyl-4-(beta-D-ribofuranosyl)aminobenzene 5'-phosphate synthase